MAFAGHPTLGTSHIVREMKSTGDEITLEMIAGVIPVHGQVDRWTLSANAAITRPAGFTQRDIADMLGLDENDVLPGACWVNTGSDQLIVPLVSEHSVRRAHPMPERLARVSSETGRSMAYIFAPLGDGRLISRFFFLKHGSVIEDPGTGSATANLGGWFIQSGARLPLAYTIDQGEAAGRPCRIGLSVDAGGHIFVSGRVVEIGRGTISLPPGASGE
jgi:PhzF family phenazine biosynthesis protein